MTGRKMVPSDGELIAFLRDNTSLWTVSTTDRHPYLDKLKLIKAVLERYGKPAKPAEVDRNAWVDAADEYVSKFDGCPDVDAEERAVIRNAYSAGAEWMRKLLGQPAASTDYDRGHTDGWAAGWDQAISQGQPAANVEPVAVDGWTLAEKVRRDLDRQSCPDVYMRVAVESIVKHYAVPIAPSAEPVGEAVYAGPLYAPGTTIAQFNGMKVPVGTKLYRAPVAAQAQSYMVLGKQLGPNTYEAVPAQPSITPADAVYGLLGWLSGRGYEVTLGAHHGAGIAADLAKAFCAANGLKEFSDGYPNNLTFPEGCTPAQPWQACAHLSTGPEAA